MTLRTIVALPSSGPDSPQLCVVTLFVRMQVICFCVGPDDGLVQSETYSRSHQKKNINCVLNDDLFFPCTNLRQLVHVFSLHLLRKGDLFYGVS